MRTADKSPFWMFGRQTPRSLMVMVVGTLLAGTILAACGSGSDTASDSDTEPTVEPTEEMSEETNTDEADETETDAESEDSTEASDTDAADAEATATADGDVDAAGSDTAEASETPSDSSEGPLTVVIEKGAEPRRVVQFECPDEFGFNATTVLKQTLTQELAGEELITGPTTSTAEVAHRANWSETDQLWTIDTEVTDNVIEFAPGTDPSLAAYLKAQARAKGFTARSTMWRNGWSEAAPSSGLPSGEGPPIFFPDEGVGVGASWTFTTYFDLDGLEVSRINKATLNSLDDSVAAFTIKFTFEAANDQAIAGGVVATSTEGSGILSGETDLTACTTQFQGRNTLTQVLVVDEEEVTQTVVTGMTATQTPA